MCIRDDFYLKAIILFSISTLIGLSLLFSFESNAYALGPELKPDLRTIVPTQIQLVNDHQREMLRFSNGIANTGIGFWQMRPEFPTFNSTDQTQKAFQMLLDKDGNLVREVPIGEFAYHPAHHHWHVADVADFVVRAGSPTGQIVGHTVKSSFCLLDVFKLDDNSPTKERTYWYCLGGYQGISPGWADEYHQSLEGQDVDITGIPLGTYYLVSKVNPDGIFVEDNLNNNQAWTEFKLTRDSNGNPKIDVTGHSQCDSPSLCGNHPTNR